MACVTLSQLLCVPTVRTEKSGSVFGVAQRFRRRHLHRLLDEHQLALEVAGEEQSRRGHQCDQAARDRRRPIHRRGVRGFLRSLVRADHQPCGHPRDERPGGQQ